MTLLLGDVPGVTIRAETAVDVYLVSHSKRACGAALMKSSKPRSIVTFICPKLHGKGLLEIQM